MYLQVRVHRLTASQVPFIPPDEPSTSYPHYVFPVVGVGVLILGVFYWAIWAKLKPKLGGYRVEAERIVEDGNEVIRYRKAKVN